MIQHCHGLWFTMAGFRLPVLLRLFDVSLWYKNIYALEDVDPRFIADLRIYIIVSSVMLNAG
jgi:hypothetical protein